MAPAPGMTELLLIAGSGGCCCLAFAAVVVFGVLVVRNRTNEHGEPG